MFSTAPMSQAEMNNAAEALGILDPNDAFASSYWILSIAMVAATVSSFMESTREGSDWQTYMSVGALPTIVAGVYYFYMCEFWVQIHRPSPYGYIAWLITVPWQWIDFSWPDISASMFWYLLVRIFVTLTFRPAGEMGCVNVWLDSRSACRGGDSSCSRSSWARLVLAAGGSTNEHSQASFTTIRFIVTAGCSINSLEYFFG